MNKEDLRTIRDNIETAVSELEDALYELKRTVDTNDKITVVMLEDNEDVVVEYIETLRTESDQYMFSCKLSDNAKEILRKIIEM